jgi:uncharacterized membrane protein YgcG
MTRSRSLNQAYPLSLCHQLVEAMSLKDGAIPHQGQVSRLWQYNNCSSSGGSGSGGGGGGSSGGGGGSSNSR